MSEESSITRKRFLWLPKRKNKDKSAPDTSKPAEHQGEQREKNFRATRKESQVAYKHRTLRMTADFSPATKRRDDNGVMSLKCWGKNNVTLEL